MIRSRREIGETFKFWSALHILKRFGLFYLSNIVIYLYIAFVQNSISVDSSSNSKLYCSDLLFWPLKVFAWHYHKAGSSTFLVTPCEITWGTYSSTVSERTWTTKVFTYLECTRSQQKVPIWYSQSPCILSSLLIELKTGIMHWSRQRHWPHNMYTVYCDQVNLVF